MSIFADLPLWAALLIAFFLVTGGAVTLIGSFGLLRLKDFYSRAHAPSLGATVGTLCILLASAISFSLLQGRMLVHEVLIVIFLTITTPVTLMLLARAALYRDRVERTGQAPQEDPPPTKI